MTFLDSFSGIAAGNTKRQTPNAKTSQAARNPRPRLVQNEKVATLKRR